MQTRGWIWVFVARRAAIRAQQTFNEAQDAPVNGAKTLRRHTLFKGINTNISFHSTFRPKRSESFGYSVSGVQLFGLTVLRACHPPQLAGDLQAI
jgi:hypothetical protein